MDDETILAQVNDMIQQQQKTAKSSGGEPKPIVATMARLTAKLAAADPPTAAELRAIQIRETECERDRRCDAWDSLKGRLGKRYANCTHLNFIARTPPQDAVLNEVRDYVSNIDAMLKEGRSVLLYGPPGTGKDHLATAIMRAAVLDAGAKVEWTDGADFYGAMRDNIETQQSERDLLARFRDPQLLCISDPVPPMGRVDSSFQLSMLFRVVDRRYRDQKVTMMTLNVASREEAEQRLSPNIIDRLGHGSLVLFCSWPSFRHLT